MSHPTKIEWTDRASNPLRYLDAQGKDVWACVKVSEECANCYAEQLAVRYDKGYSFNPSNMGNVKPYLRRREVDELLSLTKTPPGSKVFLCDMTDLFGEWVPVHIIDTVFAACALRPDVAFQILTKRPSRMAAYTNHPKATLMVAQAVVDLLGAGRVSDHIEHVTAHSLMWKRDYDPAKKAMVAAVAGWRLWPLPNVWLGTSVGTQKAADGRIPHLLAANAAVRFLSCEPLLEVLDLDRAVLRGQAGAIEQAGVPGRLAEQVAETFRPLDGIHWVIAGGESGPGHREMPLGAVASLASQCAAAGVPFFVKQSSGVRPGMQGNIPGELWGIKQFPVVGDRVPLPMAGGS